MSINGYIDHTILKPTASREEIKKLCEEAVKFNFASVCVNPVHVLLAAELLSGKSPVVCTVIGFPLGANTKATKTAEAAEAVKEGASEIDMVINIGAVLEHDYRYVQDEIEAVVRTAGEKALVKVIIETCYLSEEEIAEVSRCCIKAGAAFVKTSTGFGAGGAVAEQVKIIKEVVGDDVLIKASGGIRSKEDALSMIEAGASRIGASCGVSIVSE